MSIEENKDLVRRYFQTVVVDRDFSKFSEFTAPGFHIDRSAVPKGLHGKEGLSNQMDMLFEAFPDLDFQIVDMVAEGDKVVIRLEARGTHKGVYAGIEPTGRRVLYKALIMYRVVDGKLTEAWSNADDWGLVEQLRS